MWVFICLISVLAFTYVVAQGFKFNNMKAFWDMGGRGLFVWLSYGVSITVMALCLIVSIIERKSIIKQAEKQRERVNKIMQARAAKKAAKLEAQSN
ncbi:heme exporter protein CcmD [Glaciecola sp. 2405UD65-10]|uniref:heme exporter protein CcmD n=1 Tax=Glaciecola sp. 2405UD65-10 TaxID=3397244 RepID=UPI003B5A3014